MEWYLVEGFAAPEGFDCSEIDAQSSITYRVYVGLREAYTIVTLVALLRPLSEDRPLFSRRCFAVMPVASLQCGLRLPFQAIIQRSLRD